MKPVRLKIAVLSMHQKYSKRGVEVFVDELTTRLKQTHDVIVFSSEKKAGRRLPVLWRLYLDPYGLSILFFTLGIIPKLYKDKYDIVIPTNSGWQSLFVRLCTWLYGGKVVISGQSGKGWDDRINAWTFPNRFVALSKWSQKWIEKNTILLKTEVIPNGVDVNKFKNSKALKIDLPHPIVLSVGALTKNKRHNLTIEAVAKLQNASLVIVGEGEEKETLNALGNLLLRDRFAVYSVPHEKMPQIYKGVDVFTFPTVWWESFGIVLLEAMASGLPIVANDDPVRREIVGDMGIFVDPTAIDKYAQALNVALQRKRTLHSMKKIKKFDWDEITKQYNTLFQRIVHE